MLAEWVKGTVSCSIPSGALHCLCWGRASGSSITGTAVQPGGQGGVFLCKRQLVRHTSYSGFEGKSLGMKHCVLPLKTSQHRGRKCSVHHHPENDNCISYSPVTSIGSQAPLVLQRSQLEQLSWSSSTEGQFHLSLWWLRGTWLLRYSIPGDVKVLLIHLQHSFLTLSEWLWSNHHSCGLGIQELTNHRTQTSLITGRFQKYSFAGRKEGRGGHVCTLTKKASLKLGALCLWMVHGYILRSLCLPSLFLILPLKNCNSLKVAWNLPIWATPKRKRSAVTRARYMFLHM